MHTSMVRIFTYIHPHAHAELILEINIYRKGVSRLAPPARVFVMGRAGGELRTGSMLGSFVCGGIVSGISSGCAFVACVCVNKRGGVREWVWERDGERAIHK